MRERFVRLEKSISYVFSTTVSVPNPGLAFLGITVAHLSDNPARLIGTYGHYSMPGKGDHSGATNFISTASGELAVEAGTCPKKKRAKNETTRLPRSGLIESDDNSLAVPFS